MCGIIGAIGRKDSFKIIEDGLKIMKNRGKDGKGYSDGKRIYSLREKSDSINAIGHNLHSITGNVSQPISHKESIFASNCEIYNWKELKVEYGIRARNDSELLLKLILKIGLDSALEKLRGVYAFVLWHKNQITLARDILGVKPLWYSLDNGFGFASEKKAISEKFTNIKELNPRQILIYNIVDGSHEFKQRGFFSTLPQINNEAYALRKLGELIEEAVRIRIPDKKFGLLFSGGVDSVVIAKTLKDMGAEFTCYTAATSGDSPDLLQAKMAAEKLDLRLKYVIIDENEVKRRLERLVPLIEDNNVVKVGVSLPIDAACGLARRDRCKVIFSGSGADEIFAGYNRSKNSNNINADCISHLLHIYERNNYRDDVITMDNHLELRVPFLDKNLVSFALRISPGLKLRHMEKHILRQSATRMGVSEELAYKKKKAAQYGSGFDKVLKKMAKAGKKTKSEFLANYLPEKNLKLGAMLSGGKDSLFAAYTMQKQNYELACAIVMESQNKASYMFHTPNISLAKMQAECMEIPTVTGKTKGEKEKELDDLYETINRAKVRHGIQGIVTGAIFSQYQRERIEKVCDSLGLKVFSPLWHMDQEKLMRNVIKDGFVFVLSSIASFGLDKSWLGKVIKNSDVDKLVELNEKYGVNIAGEGGEFESLVLDCPLFRRAIKISESEIFEESENTAYFLVREAKTYKK